MIDFIADKFYYLFLGWIVMNLMQRRYKNLGSKKRNATLIQAVMIFILYIGAMIIREESLPVKWIALPLAIIAAILYFFRDKVLPYKLRCINCGKRLNTNEIFMLDANLCSDCNSPHPQNQGIKSQEKEKEGSPQELN